ncbi:hypothetical protein CQ12_27495 [Bradyrhizobium jicamae]|uniref:Uncharacterized protein n=1 Tax=Bradyrhizobium jicamae TaxID=280332 RepID=A0A0R3L026_9BRAD|nr:hypothetical protein [Bradyrhizobium jicamae]KRR01057.1 hypothetical protein CQ12_27495 [Bradyrhizobium jicamae]
MRLFAGILVAVLLLGDAETGHATVRIANDPGGRIGDYVDRFRYWRDSGEFVIIDGFCAGACTIVLGAIPHDRICLTPKAKFGFRKASDFNADGHYVPNPGATQALYSVYPPEVKRWIAQRGGLNARMIVLQGKELQRLYRPCSLDAQVAKSRQQ